MKAVMLLSLVVVASATTASVSPVSKIFQMLGDLQGKIIKEGQEAQKNLRLFYRMV